MGINQPKKGSALVWAHDLIRQLKLSDISSRDIIKIISQVSKREIMLPNGKKAYLVDYNEFINVAEAVMQKKVSDFVRDVNNFKTVVQQDREELRQKRERFNKDKALEDAKAISKPILEKNIYKRNLYLGNGYYQAYWAAEIAKADIPGYQKIHSSKSVIIHTPYIENRLDDQFVDFLTKEAFEKLVSKESKVKIPAFSWEKFSTTFLNIMSLGEEGKNSFIETKKKTVKVKKIKKEKELGKVGRALLNFLQLDSDEDEFEDFEEIVADNIHEESLLNDVKQSNDKEFVTEKITNQKIISLEEIRKSYKSKKHRNKDVKYQVYLLCQKLSNKKIEDFSLNEKTEMIQASKKYIKKLKKGDDTIFEYEKEYALLVVNHIYNYLTSFSLGFNNNVFNYMDSYMKNMKDYFEIKSKPKIIDFKISKETQKKFIKSISKVASLVLVFVVGLGAKGMTSETEEKEIIGIEHAFTDSKIDDSVSKMKVVKSYSVSENVNQSIKMHTLTNENKVEVNVLTNNQTEQQDYYSIDEAIQVSEGASVYGILSDLANETNALKPYYDSKDINRTVRSIVVENSEQEICKLYSNEDVNHYLSLDYDVIGYEIVNQYSFNSNGNYVGSEGYYTDQSLSRKLGK